MLSVVSAPPVEKVNEMLNFLECISDIEKTKQLLKQIAHEQEAVRKYKDEGDLVFAQAQALERSFKEDLLKLREDQKELIESKEALRLERVKFNQDYSDLKSQMRVFEEQKNATMQNLETSLKAANDTKDAFAKSIEEARAEIEEAKNLKLQYEGKLEKLKAMVG